MSGRKIKHKVLELLAHEDMKYILSQFAAMEVKDVIHGLFSGICSTDENTHWNGVVCMGQVVARLAEKDMEEARIIMRRLLWSLNDESGGIGWGAPESMAEIMVHHDGLAEEYIHMLISYMREDGEELYQNGNFLEHEFLQRGLLWGISRLAETRPEMLLQRGVIQDLIPYLQSPDAGVRSLAVKGLGLLRAKEAKKHMQILQDDNNMVRFFENGAIRSVSVSEVASEAIDMLAKQEAV